MHEQSFFHNALIYLLAAVISVPVAKRLGFGSVLGYLLAGIIIGPFILNLLGAEGEDLMHFAEFGVVMMLFLIGLELKPHLLWGMRRSIFGLGGLQLSISAVVIGAIALALGQSPAASITIGLMLGLSSTAIVLQTLQEKGLIKQASGRAVFSVLLLQDISVVPILALIPLLAGSGGTGSEAIHIGNWEVSRLGQVGMMLLVITTMVVLGRYAMNIFFRAIARTGLREIFTAAALLLVISAAILTEMVGLSPALGGFLAGIVLANSEYRHELEADIEPFKGLLLGLFFISVGASIDFRLLASSPWLIMGLLATLITVKFMILLVLGHFFGLKGGQNSLFSFSLAQGGEFAFVLVSFSMQNKVIGQEVSSILFLVVALSMALTPLLLLFNDKVIMPRAFQKENEEEEDLHMEEDNPLIIAGFGQFGVVLGRFLIANGMRATILDNNPDHIEVLRKYDFKVYYGDATRPALLESAGAENARILVVAVGDMQTSLRIIDLAQKHYPHLKILARATTNEHSYALMDRNVEYFKRDMFESSLNLGVEALTMLGYDRYRSHRLAQTFRAHNRKVLNELHQHHGQDEARYLSEAKMYARDLEELFQAEKEDPDFYNDCSWDASARRKDMKEKKE